MSRVQGSTTPSISADRQQAVEAVALFSVLVHAYRVNDLERAAEARDSLERLGVVVEMPRGVHAGSGAVPASPLGGK